MPHLSTCNCAKIRPQSNFFIEYHSPIMYYNIYILRIGKRSIFNKREFYDLIVFISIAFMFVPNLEPIGSSNRIKDTENGKRPMP